MILIGEDKNNYAFSYYRECIIKKTSTSIRKIMKELMSYFEEHLEGFIPEKFNRDFLSAEDGRGQSYQYESARRG